MHDGSCEFTSCGGCMVRLACDFEATATIHTGCADFVSCVGCMDPNANNHNPNAGVRDGACTKGARCRRHATTTPTPTCRMALVNSTPVWVAWRRAHATTTQRPLLRGSATSPLPTSIARGTACWPIAARLGLGLHRRMCLQLQPSANMEDGTCDHESCNGCVYTTAINYDATATRDDGSCTFVQCEELSCVDPWGRRFQRRWRGANSRPDATLDGVHPCPVLIGELVGARGLCVADGEVWAKWWPRWWPQTSPPNPHCGTQHCMYPQALNFHPDGTGTTAASACLRVAPTTLRSLRPQGQRRRRRMRHAACPDLNGDGLVQAHDLLDFLWHWHAAQ